MARRDPLTPAHPVRPGDGDAEVAARHAAAVAEWVRLGAALADPGLVASVDAAGRALVDAVAAGGTILVAGNGGSAAMASHVAAEFAGRCVRDRDPLPALSLAESPASLTAIGNDYGFDQVFVRGVRAHGRAGDVLIAMTTSGSSANILAALDAARERGLVTIALTGARGGHLAGHARHTLVVPSDCTPRIQEVHLLWTHAWCEAVDHVWADAR
ncbi:MAG: SIS domain-containing protein [Dermatophilaceae bacterium]